MISQSLDTESVSIAFAATAQSPLERLQDSLRLEIRRLEEERVHVGAHVAKIQREVLRARHDALVDSYRDMQERLSAAAEDTAGQEARAAEHRRRARVALEAVSGREARLNAAKDKALRRVCGDDVASYLRVALPRDYDQDEDGDNGSRNADFADALWRMTSSMLRVANSSSLRDTAAVADEVLGMLATVRGEEDSGAVSLLLLRLLELMEVAARQAPARPAEADALLRVLASAAQHVATHADISARDRAVCVSALFSCLRSLLKASQGLPDTHPPPVLLLAAVSDVVALFRGGNNNLADLPTVLACCVGLSQPSPDPTATPLLPTALALGANQLRALVFHLSLHGLLFVADHAFVTAVDDLAVQCFLLCTLALSRGLRTPETDAVLLLGRQLLSHRLNGTFFSAAYLETLYSSLLYFRSGSGPGLASLPTDAPELWRLFRGSYTDILLILSSHLAVAVIAHRCLLALRLLLRSPLYSDAEIEDLLGHAAGDEALTTQLSTLSGSGVHPAIAVTKQGHTEEDSLTSGFVSAEEWCAREVSLLLLHLSAAPGPPCLLLSEAVSACLLLFAQSDARVTEQLMLLVQQLCRHSTHNRLVFLESDAPKHLLRYREEGGSGRGAYLAALCELCIDYTSNTGEW